MRWLPLLIVVLGCLLRLAFGIVTPPNHAYDDHLEPTRIIVMQGRLPQPKDCWSCYHPPLYYVVSAAVFKIAQAISNALGVPVRDVTPIGQKAIQFISVAAGCITLWFCRLILRRAAAFPPLVEAAGLAFVAFLPVHVRMSAMASNDALTYALATASIYAVLRTESAGWPALGCIVTGVLCGSAVLTKVYGWIPLMAVCGYCVYASLQRNGIRLAGEGVQKSDLRRRPPRDLPGQNPKIGWRGAVLVVGAALATGVWPAVRNIAIYGKPHVDNYEIFDTPQRRQPPGALGRISFYDLRLPALFAHPWLHTATLDSFWTQMYARAWFEHVGFNNTLFMHRPWMNHRREIEAQHPIQTDPNYFSILLNYDESVTPGQYRWIAWVLYAVGLPLTMLALAGLGLMIWKARAGGATLLLSANAILCLLIPVLQTMRIPIFAAMKIEFTLCAVSSAAFAIALALFNVPGRWQRPACGVVIGLLGVVALADVAFVATLWSAVRSASGT